MLCLSFPAVVSSIVLLLDLLLVCSASPLPSYSDLQKSASMYPASLAQSPPHLGHGGRRSNSVGDVARLKGAFGSSFFTTPTGSQASLLPRTSSRSGSSTLLRRPVSVEKMPVSEYSPDFDFATKDTQPATLPLSPFARPMRSHKVTVPRPAPHVPSHHAPVSQEKKRIHLSLIEYASNQLLFERNAWVEDGWTVISINNYKLDKSESNHRTCLLGLKREPVVANSRVGDLQDMYDAFLAMQQELTKGHWTIGKTFSYSTPEFTDINRVKIERDGKTSVTMRKNQNTYNFTQTSGSTDVDAVYEAMVLMTKSYRYFSMRQDPYGEDGDWSGLMATVSVKGEFKWDPWRGYNRLYNGNFDNSRSHESLPTGANMSPAQPSASLGSRTSSPFEASFMRPRLSTSSEPSPSSSAPVRTKFFETGGIRRLKCLSPSPDFSWDDEMQYGEGELRHVEIESSMQDFPEPFDSALL